MWRLWPKFFILMNRIDARFRELKRRKEKALIAYLTVGFPTLRMLPDLVEACEQAGVDLIEFGVPFSDPLADGPTIQAASEKALANGVSPSVVLEQVRRLRRGKVRLPLALMTYYNPVFHYGLSRFCRDSRSAGVDGLIVPDLPPEEAGDLLRAARPAGLDTIFLAAPTSPPERLRRVAKLSTGFIYYVSLTGVTGARRSLPAEVGARVRALKKMTRLPVCVGFGISGPAQARAAARVADGVIVGSALTEILRRSGRRAPREAYRFLRSLKRAIG